MQIMIGASSFVTLFFLSVILPRQYLLDTCPSMNYKQPRLLHVYKLQLYFFEAHCDYTNFFSWRILFNTTPSMQNKQQAIPNETRYLFGRKFARKWASSRDALRQPTFKAEVHRWASCKHVDKRTSTRTMQSADIAYRKRKTPLCTVTPYAEMRSRNENWPPKQRTTNSMMEVLIIYSKPGVEKVHSQEDILQRTHYNKTRHSPYVALACFSFARTSAIRFLPNLTYPKNSTLWQ